MAGFRPLIRGFFFYKSPYRIEKGSSSIGFRPLIRGFFFYKGWLDTYAKEDTVPVSVPSFGDSFFIIWKMALKLSHWASFRPLIRGFFFYNILITKI